MSLELRLSGRPAHVLGLDDEVMLARFGGGRAGRDGSTGWWPRRCGGRDCETAGSGPVEVAVESEDAMRVELHTKHEAAMRGGLQAQDSDVRSVNHGAVTLG